MPDLKPVIVDLDGTLIKTDTLLESVMVLLKQNPLWCFLLPFWLLKGKACLKNNIAARVNLNIEFLPYNETVINYIKKAIADGHDCYLATGSSKNIAESVANYIGSFKGVFSTDEHTNLTGRKKADLLEKNFGKGGYIYLGNEHVDLPIWENADKAVVVSGNKQLLEKARAINKNVEHIAVNAASFRTVLKAMRIHQWVKNALIFVPLLTSHQFLSPELIFKCFSGFIAFSLAASSVYILNDLVDLESDRQHASKSRRPFAAGTMSIMFGLVLFPLLLLAGFLIASFLPVDFLIALVVYYAFTLVYSFKLKRIIMLDTIMLAALYTMRIIAGTLLIGVHFSFWLLAFSMFIFLSLAFVKRYTELVSMISDGKKKIAGRGYHTEDASMVSSFGAASGYIAVLVFSLYINSPEVADLYSKPDVLWLASPILLYWISRVWIIAHRGEMHDDPIVFAVKDLQSVITGICVFAVFMAAT
jgi:4-hydroxybenzoate polyprenyltransferase